MLGAKGRPLEGETPTYSSAATRARMLHIVWRSSDSAIASPGRPADL